MDLGKHVSVGGTVLDIIIHGQAGRASYGRIVCSSRTPYEVGKVPRLLLYIPPREEGRWLYVLPHNRIGSTELRM